MLSKDKIRDYKKQYVDEIYQKTKAEQDRDKEYIDDTFLPKVRHPHKVLRLGLGEEIVSSPAEQIVTSNPQAFVEASNKDAAARISKVINGWIDILRRQSPQPFKESVKNKLARGVNYIHPIHNDSWVTNAKGKDKNSYPVFDKRGLPVLFPMLDPMVVFASPEEDENGCPRRVVIKYERQPIDVILKYKNWSDPKKSVGATGDRVKKVEWFEFYDKDTIHCEADSEVVRHIPNPYKMTSWVRRFSGLGRRSPDGELASLIVSDIRNSRGLIEEICVMRSDIASILHLSAHKPKTITSSEEINEKNIRENLSFDSYDLNILSNMPADMKIEDLDIEQPSREAFEHVAGVMADLTRRHPFILAGFPFGSSGRQQGMADVAALRRYDTVIENTETEWATAFEKAFKVMKAIPTMLPEGLHKSDLDVDFRCTVKLKAKDPIEEDRQITLGERLRNSDRPAIDLETFHTQFMGYTQDESQSIQVKILADAVTFNNPMWVQAVGGIAIEEGNMQAVMAKFAAAQEAAQATPKTTTERIQGEAQPGSPTEGTRGARKPPERFLREG